MNILTPQSWATSSVPYTTATTRSAGSILQQPIAPTSVNYIHTMASGKKELNADSSVFINGIKYVKATELQAEQSDGQSIDAKERKEHIRTMLQRVKKSMGGSKGLNDHQKSKVPELTNHEDDEILTNPYQSPEISKRIPPRNSYSGSEQQFQGFEGPTPSVHTWPQGHWLLRRPVVEIRVGLWENYVPYFVHRDIARELFQHAEFAHILAGVECAEIVVLNSEIPGFETLISYLYSRHLESSIRTVLDVGRSQDDHSIIALYTAASHFQLRSVCDEAISWLTECYRQSPSVVSLIGDIAEAYNSGSFNGDLGDLLRDGLELVLHKPAHANKNMNDGLTRECAELLIQFSSLLNDYKRRDASVSTSTWATLLNALTTSPDTQKFRNNVSKISDVACNAWFARSDSTEYESNDVTACKMGTREGHYEADPQQMPPPEPSSRESGNKKQADCTANDGEVEAPSNIFLGGGNDEYENTVSDGTWGPPTAAGWGLQNAQICKKNGDAWKNCQEDIDHKDSVKDDWANDGDSTTSDWNTCGDTTNWITPETTQNVVKGYRQTKVEKPMQARHHSPDTSHEQTHPKYGWLHGGNGQIQGLENDPNHHLFPRIDRSHANFQNLKPDVGLKEQVRGRPERSSDSGPGSIKSPRKSDGWSDPPALDW